MKANPVTALLVLGSIACAAPVTAQSAGSSTEGATFLLLPIGAQGVAMGRAMTAMTGDESAFWNPAGLASLDRSRIVLLNNELAVGPSKAASLLLSRRGVGTLGFSYLFRDEGDQELRGSADELLGTLSFRHHLGVISAAAHLFGGLDAGVNFKVIQFRYTCRGFCDTGGTVATDYAVDAGVQWEPLERAPLRIGVAAANMGPRFQIINADQADPLPMRVRVAVAYDVLGGVRAGGDLQGWVTAEVQQRPGDAGSRSLYVGSELVAGRGDALSLRIGYIVHDPLDSGASAGLGLQFQRYRVSVAKSLAVGNLSGVSEPLSVALSIGF